MEFELNENQLLIQQNVREYAEENIEPSASERDQKQIFPKEIIQELGEMGYFGMLVRSREPTIQFGMELT